MAKPRGGRWADVTIYWPVPDTDGTESGWTARVVVRLREGGDETSWDRALLEAFADQLGHELGEAVRRGGVALADPHVRPRVWPWRVTDREHSPGQSALSERQMKVRAKFKVETRQVRDDGATVLLRPVYGGSPENEAFYKLTPAGEITLTTINFAAADAFEPGTEFFVDFSPCVAPFRS